jgi:hypothetical protein
MVETRFDTYGHMVATFLDYKDLNLLAIFLNRDSLTDLST